MRMFKSGKVNAIIDAQWGSCGKGKLAGYLCQREKPDLVVCDYMPNAGHVYVDEQGNTTTFCQIPVASLFGIPSLLGPHASVDVEIFKKELQLAKGPVWVHPLATVINDHDKKQEQVDAGRIANTAKGGHAATSKKALRSAFVELARDNAELKPYIADTQRMVQDALQSNKTVFAETAQGFDLGLNHGTSYPFVTGRDCLIGRVMDNAGAPVKCIGNVIACFRTFPIRVGNTADGHSGPCYPDQQEYTWAELGQPQEMTTVTKRVRRVFSFSYAQTQRFLSFVRPDYAFLNFVNYLKDGPKDDFVLTLSLYLAGRGCNLCLLGTGARNDEMIDLHLPDR